MLLEKILSEKNAVDFLEGLLDQSPKPHNKGSDPIFVRSYVVERHWRKRTHPKKQFKDVIPIRRRA
jgi:hypothetical protein